MRIVTRGQKIGVCNICGTHGPLTYDHIPPKGVSRLSQVAMMSIVDLLSVERPRRSTRFSQNGVKYQTLCKKCNNELLGLRYDPTLITLTKDIRLYLESTLYLPAQMGSKTRPNRLARCVVGHLLAHGVEGHRGGKLLQGLADFFLDESLQLPKELKLYYWVYPYNDQVIIKGAGISMHYWNSFAIFMLLKFFPLSFFFVLNEPSSWRVPYSRLDTMLSGGIDDEANMSIAFTGLPPQRWPEAPGDTGIVLYGDGATSAVPRTP